MCTTAAPLEEAAAVEGFTYGRLELLEAGDLFGGAGTYDRARLAQLYRGRRARVLRGWRQKGERFESVTLISPYPDLDEGRLDPGTLIVTWIR